MNQRAAYQHDQMAVLCGGNWSNTSNAGVFAMNLNNNRTNSNNNVGGRDSVPTLIAQHEQTGYRGISCPAISEINREPFLSTLKDINTKVKNQRPKKVGNLYKRAFTIEALHAAYLDAREGKRKKRGTYLFETNLGTELCLLHKELMTGTYTPMEYREFVVYEPKRRVINAPHFRDLVVQHAIYRVIYDIFDSSFIDQSYACRKGGGTHRASVYTQKEMRKYDSELYYVKLDIKKFFYSIDRTVLRALFEKKIKDKRFVDLMCLFANMNSDRGIPIGNLLSQLYALIYMNPLDHFIKRVLRIRSYVRYVDDFVMIGLTLEHAKEVKERAELFVKDMLNMELSYWMIAKIKKGINFVGYRTWKSRKFVRKHSMYKMKKAIKKDTIEPIISLIGHAKKTATIPYYARLLSQSCLLTKLPQRSRACLHI